MKIYTFYLALVLTLLFSQKIGAIENSSIFKHGHPRIIIDDFLLSEIKHRIKTISRNDYLAVYNYTLWRMKNYSPEDIAINDYQPTTIIPITLSALLSDSNDIIDYAIKCGLEMSRANPKAENDTDQRFRLISMSIIYDWLFHHLTPENKAVLQAAIASNIKNLSYFLDEPMYIGGHSRFGSASILYGLSAIWEDIQNSEIKNYLEVIRNQWVNGYNPLQSYIGKEGGYHMGWQYSSYLSLWPYLVFDKTSIYELNVLPEFIKNRPLWYIYGLRGDGTFPALGDTNDLQIGQSWCLLFAFSSYQYDDKYAEWFYQKYLDKVWAPYKVWRVIFRSTDTDPVSPDEMLPLARRFDNSGIIIARDRWDDETTQLIFKSSPFVSVTHHHKDQNHISISYKGPLLIDSGLYDRYGSDHWLNYYSRTIAHNTLVVRDPQETFKLLWKDVVNDGGQKIPKFNMLPKGEQPMNINEISSEKYKVTGITSFSHNNDCAWMVADASEAYSAKVKSYLRSVLMINQPKGHEYPVFIVKDDVALNKKLTPRILFHSNKKPLINESTFVFDNEMGGRLYGNVLYPVDSKLNSIGGQGKEWFVDGVNYSPDIKSSNNNAFENQGIGSWRVEVSKDEVTSISFITALIVDASDSKISKSTANIGASNDYINIKLFNTMVVMKSANIKNIFHDQDFSDITTIYLGNISRQEFMNNLSDDYVKQGLNISTSIIECGEQL